MLRRFLPALLPLYAAAQLVPLPLAVLALLSPTRLELHRAAESVLGLSRFAPLSAAPRATLEALILLTACLLVFELVRTLKLPAAPLVAFAALEAALGLAQVYGRLGDGPARGTWLNRNHFANLLALCGPFPLAWALDRLRSRRTASACALFALAALLLAAVVASESRAGFLAALVGLAAVPAIRKPRAIPAIAALAAAAFLLLPGAPFITRFAAQDLSSDLRTQIWRDTLGLVKDYPVFGCGLGAYESAMARYKTVAPLNTLDYAHNDALQLLAEAGVAGFALAATLAILLARAAARREGYRAAPCLAALAAMLLHSFFDFSLHLPVNALALAWVAGLAAGPYSGSRACSFVRSP